MWTGQVSESAQLGYKKVGKEGKILICSLYFYMLCVSYTKTLQSGIANQIMPVLSQQDVLNANATARKLAVHLNKGDMCMTTTTTTITLFVPLSFSRFFM